MSMTDPQLLEAFTDFRENYTRGYNDTLKNMLLHVEKALSGEDINVSQEKVKKRKTHKQLVDEILRM